MDLTFQKSSILYFDGLDHFIFVTGQKIIELTCLKSLVNESNLDQTRFVNKRIYYQILLTYSTLSISNYQKN